MEKNVIHIRNVVCRRCKMSVREILSRLKIPYLRISLGEAELERPLTDLELHNLQQEFGKVGFEIIDDKNRRLVNQIKSMIIGKVYEEGSPGNKRLSEILQEHLPYEYSHLSHVFTKIEGKSIQTFHHNIKMERIKEFLEYDELNITEIARELGYSSAAYLSTQFKKATGMTPSQYKVQHQKDRDPLDLV